MSKFEATIEVYENGRRRPEFTLVSDAGGEMTLKDFLEYTKSVLIVTADQVLKDEQSKGFDRSPIRVVDGSTSKSPAQAHPLGSIEFVAIADIDKLLTDTYDGILGRSPVLTGRYKSSNYVFHNGKQVATDMSSLKSWLESDPYFKDTDIIRFVNIQPYGRKLERMGVTSSRYGPSPRTSRTKDKKSGQVRERLFQPNGTYFLTARAVKSKYKRNTSVRFGFISGAQLGIKGSFKTGRPGKNSAGRPYLYPTITIFLNGGAV